MNGPGGSERETGQWLAALVPSFLSAPLPAFLSSNLAAFLALLYWIARGVRR